MGKRSPTSRHPVRPGPDRVDHRGALHRGPRRAAPSRPVPALALLGHVSMVVCVRDHGRRRHPRRTRRSVLVSTPVFLVALVAVFVLWRCVEGTVDVHTITSTRRQLFYWAAVITTFAMGTAAGDLAASTLHLGVPQWRPRLHGRDADRRPRPRRDRARTGQRVLDRLRSHPSSRRVLRRLRRVPRAPRRPSTSAPGSSAHSSSSPSPSQWLGRSRRSRPPAAETCPHHPMTRRQSQA